MVHGLGKAFSDAGGAGDVLDGGFLEALHGTEVGEEDLLAFFADAGDVVEEGFADSAVSEGAVIGEGEAVGFVANAAQNAEAGGIEGKSEGRLAVADVPDDFFEAFGESDGGEIVQAEFVEGAAAGAELGDAAVEDDKIGEGFVFLEQSAVASVGGLGDHAGVVGPFDGFDFEALVAASVGTSVNRTDHGGNGLLAEGVGDIKGFDDAGGDV